MIKVDAKISHVIFQSIQNKFRLASIFYLQLNFEIPKVKEDNFELCVLTYYISIVTWMIICVLC